MKMQTKLKTQQQEEYKETELGLLPKSWNIINLKGIADVRYGKSRPKEKGTIPVVGSGGVYAYTSRPIINEPTIVIGRKGTAGKLWLMKEPCYPSDTTFYLDWNKEVNVYFVFNYMCLHPLSGEHAKTTLPSLQKPDLEKQKIPMPSYAEQQKIAYVLSTIQETKEKTGNTINALKELKKSMMKQLFTYGPVSLKDVDKVELKETDIGEIPEEWKVGIIKDSTEKTNQKDMRKENIKFKYVDVSSIDREYLKIINHTLHYGKTSPSRARKIVKKHDVIVATVRPTLKRIALVPEEYDDQICSTAFCVLRTKKEKLNPEYLFYSSQRPQFFDKLGALQRGASYPAVTDSDIKNQRIVLPSLACQQEIVSILSSVDNKIEKEENKKRSLEELFKSMLHNLMTAKIRVNDLVIPNGGK